MSKRTMQWIVSPRYASYPKNYADGDVQRTHLLQQMLDLNLSIVEKEGADFEDFTEEAYRLDAALQGFGPENVWITGATPFSDITNEQMFNAVSGEVTDRPSDTLPGYIFDYYGMQRSTRSHLGSPLPQEMAADQYMYSSTFNKFAGRKIEIAGYYSKRNDIFEVIKRMYDGGVRKFFVKLCQTKAGIFRFSFGLDDETNGELTLATIREIVDAEVSDHVMHRLESNNVFMVQEDVDMTYEYRMFMVESKAVTGAGCIEEFTPLDNLGNDFDARMRKHRNEDEPLKEALAYLEIYRSLAQDVALSYAQEIPEFRNYVLDFALVSDAEHGFKPVLIEVNGLLNCGLYATRPIAVTTALAQAYVDGKRNHLGYPV